MDVSGQHHASFALPSGIKLRTFWIGDGVGPRAGLVVKEKGQIFVAPYGILFSDHPASSTVSILPTLIPPPVTLQI